MWKWILGGFVALVVTVVVAWMIAYPTYYYRFKLIITVDDAGTRKSAESVIEIMVTTSRFGEKIPYGTNHYPRGVAPILDLGPKGTLIAALAPESVIGGKTGRPDSSGGNKIAYAVPLSFVDKQYRFIGPGPFRVEPDHTPQFIWLPSGAKHPSAAIPLVPSEFPKYIAPDVHLVSVEVMPTRTPVHTYIRNPPAWLTALREIERKRKFTHPRQFNFILNTIETKWPPATE